jgi:hypothetical protein
VRERGRERESFIGNISITDVLTFRRAGERERERGFGERVCSVALTLDTESWAMSPYCPHFKEKEVGPDRTLPSLVKRRGVGRREVPESRPPKH